MFSEKTGILFPITNGSQRRRMRLERKKKYIWGCVLCALLTAVLIGMIYYYNDVRGTDQVSEGTLIWQALPVKERTDTDAFGK